jgi:prepilin-type N-terminal cleavage/methylation domain-containing protein
MGCSKLRSKGFTIIELVMVIAILAVLAVVAIASAVDMGPMRQLMAARKIQSDIRYAQSLAASIQKWTRLDFNTTTDTYTLNIEDTPGSWSIARDPLSKENFTVQLNSGEFQNIAITQVYFNAAGRSLAFDEWGNPYGYDVGSGTSSVLTNPAGVTITGPNVVTVERGTGRVYIQ